jgi:hypothetical protein
MKLLIILCCTFALNGAQLVFTGEFPELLETFTNDTYTYMLRIKFPPLLHKIPPICSYYKGKKLTFDQDFALISETKNGVNFSLFITQPEYAPKPKCDGNTIRYFERHAHKPGKFFHINRLPYGSQMWRVIEKKVEHIPLRLPDDTIILLLDPKFVSEIKQIADSQLVSDLYQNNLIALPTIILKPDLNQEELTHTTELSLLAACDLNTFHMPTKEKTQVQRFDKVMLSMQTP